MLKLNRFKKYTLGLFLLIFPFLSYAQNLVDSVDKKPAEIEIIVTADHVDWTYKTGENVNFKVSVRGKQLEDLKISYEIGPEKMAAGKKGTLILANGIGTITAGTMKSPGFLRCIVSAKVNNKVYTGFATAGFEPEKIRATAEVPNGFLSFWNKAKADAARIPLNTQMNLITERSGGDVNVYRVSFQNNQLNSRIYGILCIPKKEGKYPAFIRFPGAGVRSYNGGGSLSLATEGMITLDIGIHGIPINLDAEVYNGLLQGALSGYPLFNLDNPDQYYFKRVIQGCLKSVDLIYSLPQFDGSTLAVMGSSQGGALSIITTALDSRIKYLVALCPALSDLTGYLHGRAGGWPHMFSPTNIEIHGTPGKIKTSSFYDVANFARLIKVPGFYSWGFNDETTPPTSTYAVYNNISAPKELFIVPEGRHKIYQQQREKYTSWILEKARVTAALK
ncbi:acetylxylan esterase [Pedobacter immunditicola]|uniref:acetylxylan esterase n=1 Tax=Pedobacter immunditicola TaxID=3133440 RepID=UPI0030B21AC0